MIMRTIDPVVVYCMQISMCNYMHTGEAIVMANYDTVHLTGCCLLYVYREIVNSVTVNIL